jgi:methylated-DNA-[protein]-cysteine S-methyltransferase
MKHAAEKFVTDYAMLDSPVGSLLIGGDQASVLLIGFSKGSQAVTAGPEWRRDDSLYANARSQLCQYFAGERAVFDFSMTLIGTDFQKQCWEALVSIPYGETRTYTMIAGEIGRPKAVRAVGAANGANPLPIVIPCHRLLGADGSLTGFGGGIDMKRYLLDLETNPARA